jgi:hypothetical protein
MPRLVGAEYHFLHAKQILAPVFGTNSYRIDACGYADIGAMHPDILQAPKVSYKLLRLVIGMLAHSRSALGHVTFLWLFVTLAGYAIAHGCRREFFIYSCVPRAINTFRLMLTNIDETDFMTCGDLFKSPIDLIRHRMAPPFCLKCAVN